MEVPSDTARSLSASDLTALSDSELLDHLERVSAEVRRRNSLMPRGEPAADAVRAAVDAVFSAIRR